MARMVLGKATCHNEHLVPISPIFLWTWKSPRDRYRNRNDNMRFNLQFRNTVNKVNTRPEEDCCENCYHVQVVVELNLKQKKVRKKMMRIRKD